MNKLYLIGAPLAVLAVLAGCQGGGASGYKPKPAPKVESAEVKAGEEQSLFPLAVGSQWVYTVGVRVSTSDGKSGQQQSEITLRCTKVDDVEGGKEATLEARNAEGTVTDTQVWKVTDKGIFQVAAGTKAARFEPPVPNVTFPIAIGETVAWKGKGPMPAGEMLEGTAKVKTLGYQEIDTDMGRMSALAVETRFEWGGQNKGVAVGTAWWRPNYGFVRFRQEIVAGERAAVQLLKLKSYTPGK